MSHYRNQSIDLLVTVDRLVCECYIGLICWIWFNKTPTEGCDVGTIKLTHGYFRVQQRTLLFDSPSSKRYMTDLFSNLKLNDKMFSSRVG